MPAPIDLSSALGSPVPEDVPAPAPGGGPDYFNDPLAGIEPSPDDPPMEGPAMSDDPAMALCQELFPEWGEEQHQKLLELIDARLGQDNEPDADEDAE